MPDVTVHNQTSARLNIGFCIATPLAFVNEVQPDQTIRLHLSSFVHTVEVRYDNGSNRFCAEESWQKAGEISGACAAGVAAVTLGTGWLLGTFGPHASWTGTAALTGASAAWGAAQAGGARYAQSADGVVVNVPGVWIPFNEKKLFHTLHRQEICTVG